MPTLRIPFSGERQNLLENLNLKNVAENRKPRETANNIGVWPENIRGMHQLCFNFIPLFLFLVNCKLEGLTKTAA